MKKNSFIPILVLSLLLLLVISACKDDKVSPEEQAKIDRALIEEYVAANSLNGQFTASGLYYIITKEGSLGSPDLSSTVTVNYAGKLLNGTPFDSGQGISFALSGVIQGWQEGIRLLKKGGAGTLIIPSGLAYGPSGRSTIPANAVLYFDVDLLDFN